MKLKYEEGIYILELSFYSDKDLHEVDHYDEELPETKILKEYGF